MSENFNFGKPLQDYTDDELFNLINNSKPQFGNLAHLELMRRFTLENSKSSKRFALASLGLAVVAIIISLVR